MIAVKFIIRQFVQIRNLGWKELLRKFRLSKTIILSLPFIPVAVLIVIVIRLISVFYVVRIGRLVSGRIGHFAANTELYLCELDAGINTLKTKHVDLWYHECKPCNRQLHLMWCRVLFIVPAIIFKWVDYFNGFIIGGKRHKISFTTNDRDINHLLDRFPAHLQFTTKEEKLGQAGLRTIGIPRDAKFVCITVRDSAYLDVQAKAAYAKVDRSYHNYRDCDVSNFVLAAIELANRGYYVLRMGAVVKNPIPVSHPRIIDYALNGMRSDFMDIYLGANCEFCISTQTGFDAIPYIFRRPIVYVNSCPLMIHMTFSKGFIALMKHHVSKEKDKELTLLEIFDRDVGFCMHSQQYEDKNILLRENTPEEIRDVAIEMVERLNGTWKPHPEDEELQKRFWDLYSNALDRAGNRHLHGEFRSKFGASFLRNNPEWLQ